ADGQPRADLGDAVPARRHRRAADGDGAARPARRPGTRTAGTGDGADGDRHHRARGAGLVGVRSGVPDPRRDLHVRLGLGGRGCDRDRPRRDVHAPPDLRGAAPRRRTGGARWRPRPPVRGARNRRAPRRVPARAVRPAGRDHRPGVRQEPPPGTERPPGPRPVIASIATPHVDWFALSPSLALLGSAGVSLLAAVLVPRTGRRAFSAWVCALGYAGAFVAAALLYDRSGHGTAVIAEAMRRDRWAALSAIVVAAAGLLAVGVSYNQRIRVTHVAEYYSLLAAAGAGMVFLAAANNLMVLFLSLEWFSICLYILCAIDYELVGALEAGLKYPVVGGFGSAFLLFGSALVYGATGELQFDRIAAATSAQGLTGDTLLIIGLALMLAGLGYKASAAPFHMWTPDVYEGAPTPVTAFMSAATKTVALILTLRVLTTAFPREAHLWAPE